MDIQRVEEIFAIPDTAERCQRVRDEVQPILKEMMSSFQIAYGNQASELLDYHLQTPESTLRTAMGDLRNPKYADGARNAGRQAFARLIDRRYFQTEFGVLTLELNGPERVFRIMMASSFYPFWDGVRSLERQAKLEQIISLLPAGAEIWAGDKNVKLGGKEELVPYILKAEKDRGRPWIYVGRQIPFDRFAEKEQDWSARIWEIWCDLKPIRDFISQEASVHALSVRIADQLNQNEETLSVQLYGRSYEIVFEATSNKRSNQPRQRFGIYDKGQLLTNGTLQSLLREPHEVLGVVVDNHGHLYTQLRNLHGEGKVEWSGTKSFRYPRVNGQDLNKWYQERAIEALQAHGFRLEGNEFYIGTWDNDQFRFEESVAEIKRRLIVAAVLFADCAEKIMLPRASVEKASTADAPEQAFDEYELAIKQETYEHNFDLISILSSTG